MIVKKQKSYQFLIFSRTDSHAKISYLQHNHNSIAGFAVAVSALAFLADRTPQ